MHKPTCLVAGGMRYVLECLTDLPADGTVAVLQSAATGCSVLCMYLGSRRASFHFHMA
jgi:hypothetical protein